MGGGAWESMKEEKKQVRSSQNTFSFQNVKGSITSTGNTD